MTSDVRLSVCFPLGGARLQDELPPRFFSKMFTEPRYAVALQDSDADSLELSASGGAFAVFARSVLNEGGAVFGASLLDDGTVCHICIRRSDALSNLQGSKYVRSDVADTYGECAHLLRENVKVLYSGTPCQIAALRKYLEKKVPKDVVTRKLLCIDLICHGTPKQDIFAAYLEWLAMEKKTDDGIHGYVFRSKKMGWGLNYYYYYYYYRGGRKHEVLGPARDDPYFSAFTRGAIYRECCYKCIYARIERVGDITIGDYWGIESVHPDFSDGRGVSAVLLNTEKGESFFNERCVDACRWVKSSVEDIVAHNSNLVAPTIRSADDAKLADQVERAISAGDYGLAFGELLAPKFSLSAKIRQMIPWRIFRAVFRHRQ